MDLNDYITTKDDPEELFQLLEKLGQGTYGSVYKALHKDSGKIVAAKIISIEGDVESFKKEIKILNECHSPYILQYYGSYYKNSNIWLIIEYCDAGSVLDLMKITKRNLTEEHIASIMHMTLRGLQFLHERKKIHRDIKAGNILINHEGYAKLADFGVSAQMKNSFSKKHSRIGTPYWMSPEVIKKSEHNQSTDIWSLGITCIEMAEGEPPYSDTKPWKAMMIIISNPPRGLAKPHIWSNEFNSFVADCLNINSERRPPAKELLNHPFIIENARGSALIGELVSNSIDEINKYRIERFHPNNSSSYDMEEEDENEQSGEENNCGTVIKNDEKDFATMLVNNESTKKDTIQGKINDNTKKDAPEFMKYINEMDISYDEFMMETDLYQNMEKRRKGNDDDLRALNLMEEEKPLTSRNNLNNKQTMTAEREDVSSENSQSILKNKKKIGNGNYSCQNRYENELSNNNSINFSSEINEKKLNGKGKKDENLYKQFNQNVSRKVQFDEKILKSDNSTTSKEHSTIKMSINKPLIVNPLSLLGREENINIEEENLIDDNELKRMGVVMIEDKLKNLYQSLEREIMLIKQRFGKKINKFETALEFLKINPHLKNLKEYEDYSKFSKFLDQSKFSVYSSKSGFDESIGGQSILPLNTIKVTKYKNNDINEKNK